MSLKIFNQFARRIEAKNTVIPTYVKFDSFFPRRFVLFAPNGSKITEF